MRRGKGLKLSVGLLIFLLIPLSCSFAISPSKEEVATQGMVAKKICESAGIPVSDINDACLKLGVKGTDSMKPATWDNLENDIVTAGRIGTEAEGAHMALKERGVVLPVTKGEVTIDQLDQVLRDPNVGVVLAASQTATPGPAIPNPRKEIILRERPEGELSVLPTPEKTSIITKPPIETPKKPPEEEATLLPTEQPKEPSIESTPSGS